MFKSYPFLGFCHFSRRGSWYLKDYQVFSVPCPFWPTLQVGCYKKRSLYLNFLPPHMICGLVKTSIGQILLLIFTAVVLSLSNCISLRKAYKHIPLWWWETFLVLPVSSQLCFLCLHFKNVRNFKFLLLVTRIYFWNLFTSTEVPHADILTWRFPNSHWPKQNRLNILR